MPNHHFIAKFVCGGGPDPEEELQHIIDQADNSEDGTAWFATKLGAQWQPAPSPIHSMCIVFYNDPEKRCITAMIAKILQRNIRWPDTPVGKDLEDMYEGYGNFGSWWQVQDPIMVQFQSLGHIPGVSQKTGQPARITFGAQTAFAYWTFDQGSHVELYTWVLDQVLQQGVEPPNVARPEVAEVVVPACALRGPAILVTELLARPTADIYGVDFSGGEESPRRGNPKIWIASWHPTRNEVTLRCGTDNPHLCRRDLPDCIRSRPGWWVLDFPFGIAQETAVAILENNKPSWEGWLRWCAEGNHA
ncbi:MAG TPA: hypothetical protein VG097_20080, partial [Gemmata sp.]|nr:hypothetical protein [Gemmata sp.]